jgi:hypothetical protein
LNGSATDTEVRLALGTVGDHVKESRTTRELPGSPTMGQPTHATASREEPSPDPYSVENPDAFAIVTGGPCVGVPGVERLAPGEACSCR